MIEKLVIVIIILVIVAYSLFSPNKNTELILYGHVDIRWVNNSFRGVGA